MQCVTPMFRLYDISTKETIRIIPRAEVMQGLELNGNYIRKQLDKMNMYYLRKNQLIQTIPCNHCYACKLNKSAEWATRCMLETLDHESAYWLTLTYDEEHLPILDAIKYNEIYETDTHNIIVPVTIENDGTWINGSLFPKHIDEFIKKIRNKFRNSKIRYFYCGEYGEQNQRPHYHMLLYGLPMDLSQNYGYHIDENNKEHWKNPLIDELWVHGLHDITNLEWSNAAYTARYTMKKLTDMSNSNQFYAEQGKLKEYVRMSRRPGIGMNYLKNHYQDIYKNDSMIMKTVKGNTGAFKPPKAFDRVFKEMFPEDFERIQKHRRECAERSRHNKYYQSNYSDLESLQMNAEKIATKANMLKREL